MSIPQKDVHAFELAVLKHFSYLETDFNLHAFGVSVVDDDPRDSCMVARYRQDDFRVDVAWNPLAMSLNVVLRVDNRDLGRRERSVYLEPFVEFISNGDTVPVVPQIYPGISVSKIEEAMQLRQELFAGGNDDSLRELANRLKLHLSDIRGCAAKTVRDYHAWYQTRGKDA